ncbi:hypothetical protein DPMN_169979 [Dreissena polymorpha]|uniref:Uncharacterized protein n=1 Tax=Dreissena polymorpha TaxID=45954 RepID=A0A9D4DVD2_DREPO|nr:hypothetical protein DPMN_169979 [Dreissena polymorpha]
MALEPKRPSGRYVGSGPIIDVRPSSAVCYCLNTIYTMHGMKWDAFDPHIPTDEENKMC